MSRRKIMVFAAVVVAALGVGCYLPQYFSSVPELVIELRSCLEPADDDANGDTVNGDPPQLINVEVLVVGFNTTRAGTTLLADADNEGRAVTGRVKELQRLKMALRRLEEERCICVLSKPSLMTLSGQTASLFMGQSMAVVNGVSIEQKEFGTAIEAMPSLQKDGRISLQLDLFISEAKGFVTRPAVNPEFEVVKAKTTIVLNAGQTCFVGGLMRRSKETQIHRLPLVSDLPGIGTLFQIRQQVEFDEELLMLATPTLVPPR